MTAAACDVQSQAILAFDSLAARYDDLFTQSTIGRAQRGAVWDALLQTFAPGSRILELNCGTGEDALFLHRHHMSVTACDASLQMVETGRRRMQAEAPGAAIAFHHLATERLAELAPDQPFEGAFSNFSGLNCVANLQSVARDLTSMVTSDGSLLLCLSTRFCLVETLWFLSHGNVRKAFRRTPGFATAKVDEFVVNVHYPTLREVTRLFAPSFRLVACTGIGITVPPSYLEPAMRRHPRLLSLLSAIDKRIARLPWLRVMGDHMLLHLERKEGTWS